MQLSGSDGQHLPLLQRRQRITLHSLHGAQPLSALLRAAAAQAARHHAQPARHTTSKSLAALRQVGAGPAACAHDRRTVLAHMTSDQPVHKRTFQGMMAVKPGLTGTTPDALKVSPAAVKVAEVRLDTASGDRAPRKCRTM